MASAARAYSYAPKRAPRRESLRVVPGGGGSQELSSQIIFIAKVFMIVLAVFACVACLRIGLASATVTTSIQTESINEQINEIRSGSAHLEVTESTLSNPASIKSAAVKQLNMTAPSENDVLHLGKDVVVYDEEGNLSLARSLALSPLG